MGYVFSLSVYVCVCVSVCVSLCVSVCVCVYVSLCVYDCKLLGWMKLISTHLSDDCQCLVCTLNVQCQINIFASSIRFVKNLIHSKMF